MVDDTLYQARYVVLHIGTGPSLGSDQSGSSLVLPGEAEQFELTNDIWIERLDEQLAKNVQRACEPANYNVKTVSHDRHIYAFVRRVPEFETRNYEGLEALLGVIGLSRVIHPTSTGTRYCAKIFGLPLRDYLIQAIQYRGVSPDVFLEEGVRDWLSVKNGQELLSLRPWISNKPMLERVHRAYWNHDFALHSYYLDARWVLVVSGLEALINVDEDKNALQFRVRVGALANELKVHLTDSELRIAWKLRSKLAHAKGFLFGLGNVLPQSDHKKLYGKLELLLRLVLKRCLLDEGFCSRLRNNTTVRKNWPL
jgi:hypothetical protein